MPLWGEGGQAQGFFPFLPSLHLMSSISCLFFQPPLDSPPSYDYIILGPIIFSPKILLICLIMNVWNIEMRILFQWSNLGQELSISCSIPCFEIPEITIYLGSLCPLFSLAVTDKGNQKPEVGICKLRRLCYITVLWLADYLFQHAEYGAKQTRSRESVKYLRRNELVS